MSQNIKKSIEVNIAGTILQVKNDDNEAEIEKAVTLANNELEKIRQNNPNINRIYLMVMGCMNLADMYLQSENDNQSLKEEIQDLSDNNHSHEIVVEKKDAEIEALKNKIDNLFDTQNKLKKQLNEKNDLLNQYRDHIKQIKEENEANRKNILDLQNKLFESQIELNKTQNS
ncbi:cell division protein ZapA [Pseudoramibacter sp.]|jgi:cell division protein ZapA|uniref:cell division protein ZapA n=1 Tax=Pseudoramibacter sp. TaxID=2034862 RepID=UPI0025DD8290|nr:cell division protein ZapA [Pseudoramibacter sp.]MCH4072855.1 cell division protein ZapA [Pseudoramibacter sp.]MCH4106626.1 cell division protein ZapA [Pseudoramibacter sp.]